MPINLEYFPSHSLGISESTNEENMILYSSSSEQALLLNPSSSVVWKLCDGNSSVSDIITTLIKAFPESKNQIELDVIDALQSFLAAGVIYMQEAN